MYVKPYKFVNAWFSFDFNSEAERFLKDLERFLNYVKNQLPIPKQEGFKAILELLFIGGYQNPSFEFINPSLITYTLQMMPANVLPDSSH
jgi:hypothetical protein